MYYFIHLLYLLLLHVFLNVCNITACNTCPSYEYQALTKTAELYICIHVVYCVTPPARTHGYTNQSYTVPSCQYILYTVYCITTVLLNYII